MIRSEWRIVHGRRLHVRTAGPDGRSPIVLVHGLGVSSLYFVPLMRSLSRDFRVLAPDLPGFGRSDKPRAILSLAELTAEIVAFLDTQAIERAVFVGNSMGCQLLIDLAIGAPERVDRMVLVGPTVDARYRTFVRQIPRWLLETWREPLSIYPALLLDYLRCGARRFFATGKLALADRVEDKLPAVRAPTHVIRGERDAFVSAEWCARVAELLPRGSTSTIAGAPHAAHFTDPERVAGIVRAGAPTRPRA